MVYHTSLDLVLTNLSEVIVGSSNRLLVLVTSMLAFDLFLIPKFGAPYCSIAVMDICITFLFVTDHMQVIGACLRN